MELSKSSAIICPQCGGENKISADERFFECEYCGSAVYVDKRKVVSHFIVSSNFTNEQSEGNLRRWMAGNFHVKDLDKNARITQVNFYYFPLWYFKTSDNTGDKIYLQPAHSTPVSEIKNILIPAGSLKPYNRSDYNVKDFVDADVLYESARNWLSQTGVNTDNISESNLVHVPFYHFYYTYKDTQYTAIVEASSGKVYANIWPAKSEMPFRAMFAAALIVFALASLLSFVISYFLAGKSFEGVLLLGEGIKLVLYLIAAIPLAAMAYMIAKKV
jgi:DNA-directed RNA polymerase subunit RPC12/RpoP